MSNKRTVEIFSAGCQLCEAVIERVRDLACPSCEVQVLDLNQDDVAEKARQYGIDSAPAVAVDGDPVKCCKDSGVKESNLREAGIGQPLS
jgi:uncharacterized Zn ribbon protein